jgi:hypothetical protein
MIPGYFVLLASVRLDDVGRRDIPVILISPARLRIPEADDAIQGKPAWADVDEKAHDD